MGGGAHADKSAQFLKAGRVLMSISATCAHSKGVFRLATPPYALKVEGGSRGNDWSRRKRERNMLVWRLTEVSQR
jgi:hypothetical protein